MSLMYERVPESDLPSQSEVWVQGDRSYRHRTVVDSTECPRVLIGTRLRALVYPTSMSRVNLHFSVSVLGIVVSVT